MKKYQFFFGAMIFTLAGFFFEKAYSKYAAGKAYFKTFCGTCLPLDNATATGGTRFSTVGGAQAYIRTSNGNYFKTLFSNSTCTSPVYFKF